MGDSESSTLDVKAVYTEDTEQNRDMLSNVTAGYITEKLKGFEQLKDNREKYRQVMFYCDNELIYIHFIIAVFNYNSRESSASTHICKFPSRYNFAYSSGSSIASAFNAQSDPGVVFKFFSASQQSMRSI